MRRAVHGQLGCESKKRVRLYLIFGYLVLGLIVVLVTQKNRYFREHHWMGSAIILLLVAGAELLRWSFARKVETK
jgi:hypothetical protein